MDEHEHEEQHEGESQEHYPDEEAATKDAQHLSKAELDEDRLSDSELADDELADDELTDDEKAGDAADTLEGILERMGLDVRVRIGEEDDDEDQIVLDIDGHDVGRVIGKRGQTLDALQFLVNKIVNRYPENRRYIVVDAGGYRERHDRRLTQLAKQEAERAVEQGETVSLQPMPPRDRRLIHLSLAKFSGVTTESAGEGMQRRIQIIPSSGSQSEDLY